MGKVGMQEDKQIIEDLKKKPPKISIFREKRILHPWNKDYMPLKKERLKNKELIELDR